MKSCLLLVRLTADVSRKLLTVIGQQCSDFCDDLVLIHTYVAMQTVIFESAVIHI